MRGSPPVDTNESRRRHADRIRFGTFLDADRRRVRTGHVYACPRCPYTSRTMRHREGAERLADQHQLKCEPSSPAALPERV